MDAINDDPGLLRLARKHREYEERLAVLQRRRFLTAEQRLEESNLKKLKLRVKDEMQALRRHESRPAGRHG